MGKLKKGQRKQTKLFHFGRSSDNEKLNIEEMNVNDTNDGIEVSLDFFSPESREPQPSIREPVISVKEQIRQRQRVYRTQFSVSFPALQSQPGSNVSLDNWRPKDHRIPLLGISSVEDAYADVLNLLSHSQVTDEYTAVKKEVEQLGAEIDALERDRQWLDRNWKKSTNSKLNFSPTKMDGSHVDWDVRELLDSKRIGQDDRERLQLQRGNCLTIHFQNPRAKEVFLTKCGAKIAHINSNKRRAPGDTITLGTSNCRPGGAGTSVRHLAMMSNNNGSQSAFFFSRDTGKAQAWGHLPPKLYRRMQGGGTNSGNEIGDLIYLSTGPHGSYYAEFRSGECWWGSAVQDDDFHSIIQAWDVYRVVFGPIETFEDERGNSKFTNSWIILGRDGRAAWKNLPSRLHHRLESRLANWAAPAEVAFGPGDSYFIRFLDGTVDYCLPAEVAQVCDYIERHGGSITDIALHPEISHDFMIRHTEMR